MAGSVTAALLCAMLLGSQADGVGAVLAWLKHRIHASIALPQRSMLLAVPQPELKLRVPHILRYGNDRMIVMRTGWIELWENADWEIHRDPWQDPRHE